MVDWSTAEVESRRFDHESPEEKRKNKSEN